MRSVKSVLLLPLAMTVAASAEAGLLNDFQRANRNVERNVRNEVRKLPPGSDSARVARAVERAVSENNRETLALTAELARQKEALEVRAEALQNEKADLEVRVATVETRERFFSVGFFASTTAATVAILGLFFRLPNIRLERELRRLEILEKQRQLGLELDDTPPAG